jgi:hypothetical protein
MFEEVISIECRGCENIPTRANNQICPLFKTSSRNFSGFQGSGNAKHQQNKPRLFSPDEGIQVKGLSLIHNPCG